MQQLGEPIRPRPGSSLTFVVGGLGFAYLAIGFLIVWAYATTWSSTRGVELRWEEVPSKAPWLLPGILLLVSIPFIHRQRWAVVIASAIFCASVAAAVLLLARSLLAVRVIPKKAPIYISILTLWLCILSVGLSRLRRQWAWLRSAALPPGAGFPLDDQ